MQTGPSDPSTPGPSPRGDARPAPRLAPVVLGLIVTRSLAYGMLGPARESLFTLVPRDLRYKGKNAVDTAVWRLGDLTISLGMNGLRMFGIAVSGFAAISAASAAVAGFVGFRLARQVEGGSASTDTASSKV